MKFIAYVIQALLLLSPLGLCSTSAAETDVWHELLHAMRFADINRAQLESSCRDDSRYSSVAHLKKLCEKRNLIPDTIIEEAALPYLQRYVSERIAKDAITQLNQDAARNISNRLLVEISSGRKNQLTQYDLIQLKQQNESEYGRALSNFASDREQGLAVARALIAYEPNISFKQDALRRTTLNTPVSEEEKFLPQLQGMWCEREASSNYCVAQMEIRMDRTVKNCVSLPASHKHSRSTAILKITGRNTCFKVSETDDNSSTPLGYEFCFELQEVNALNLTFKLAKTGQVFRYYRMPPGSPTCPAVAN